MEIKYDKRIDLILGLIYSVNNENNCNFNWVTSMMREYGEEFYELYKKNITPEFKEYIMNFGLDSYDRCIYIALSLNENYEIENNKDIEEIVKYNQNFNSKDLSKFIKEFVDKIDYENLFRKYENNRRNYIKEFEEMIDTKGESITGIIESFYGYSKGKMNIILAPFSRGNYGIKFNNEIYYISEVIVNKNNWPYTLSLLFHEFSHPYINELGEKYFCDINIDELLKYSKDNNLGECYDDAITLINEYVVRVVQIILSRDFYDNEILFKHISDHKNEGFIFIENLIQVFNNKDNYDTFEEFYKNEIVEYFIKLENNIIAQRIK